MKSILIVEGSNAIMELIRFLLTIFGYEIKEATDRFEAFKITKVNRLDLIFLNLILLNLQLSGSSRLQNLKEIKKLSGIDRTSVIILTAHFIPSDGDRFLKSGCSGCISKSIDINILKSMLDSCMSGHLAI